MEIRLATFARRVRAVQDHRAQAKACADDVRRALPRVASNGLPTLVCIGGAECGPGCTGKAFAESVVERHRARGLNGVWARIDPGERDAASTLDAVDARSCLPLAGARANGETIVLDRAGAVFFAGDRENELKATLWIPDADYRPSPSLVPGVPVRRCSASSRPASRCDAGRAPGARGNPGSATARLPRPPSRRR